MSSQPPKIKFNYVFQVFLLIIFSMFSFLIGYFIKQHEIIPCPQPIITSNIPKTDLISPQTIKPKLVIPRTLQTNQTTIQSPPLSMKIYKFPPQNKELNWPSVLTNVFSMYYHPTSPVSSEILLQSTQLPSKYPSISEKTPEEPYQTNCQKVYLTRTGSLANMPNKCLAVSFVNEHNADPVPHSLRLGKIAGMVNMYQPDYTSKYARKSARILTQAFIEHLGELQQDLLKLLGSPIRSNGTKRSIMIIVLNEGVLDIFLNFICSCQASGVTTIYEDLVVFIGQPTLTKILTNMGFKVFYSPHLGQIPKDAAGAYGDGIFGSLMWFKASALYLATSIGFNVLFQVSLFVYFHLFLLLLF